MKDDGRPNVAVSLECLVDARPAMLWVIYSLSGASPADVEELERSGYEDPWELARVANCWVRAGRPRPLPHAEWRIVVNQCGGDPGDLQSRGERLYAHLGWRREVALVPVARIQELAGRVRLAVVTDRDRGGLARGEEVLGFQFPQSVTVEDAKRPDAEVLTRLGGGGHFLGHGPRDRACAEGARYAFHELGKQPLTVVERLIARLGGSGA